MKPKNIICFNDQYELISMILNNHMFKVDLSRFVKNSNIYIHIFCKLFEETKKVSNRWNIKIFNFLG
jgi:hypothetical protein